MISLRSFALAFYVSLFGLSSVVNGDKYKYCKTYPDPHFNTWNNFRYDYHVPGTFILIENSLLTVTIECVQGLGFSYVETAWLDIGGDRMAFNFRTGPDRQGQIGGYKLEGSDVFLDDGQYIMFRYYPPYGLDITAKGLRRDFGDSDGMCGMWDEPGYPLYVENLAPPANPAPVPMPCICDGNNNPPDHCEVCVTELGAQKACAAVPLRDGLRENCEFDVRTTGDVNWAAQPIYLCYSGGCQGDPHFYTWNGDCFDYHGQCDLVLVDAPEFGEGIGLLAQVRTKIRYTYSFIESAAIKIGEDVLEVGSWGEYFLNGVDGASMSGEMGPFVVTHEAMTKTEHIFKVTLEAGFIVIKTFKDIVSVKFQNVTEVDFRRSSGLMGQFETGKRLARDGRTVLEDNNAFGQEWQVLPSEPMLFQTEPPMSKCILPANAAATRRRLGETIARRAAETACTHRTDREQCVFDVMATGDLEMAQAGLF